MLVPVSSVRKAKRDTFEVPKRDKGIVISLFENINDSNFSWYHRRLLERFHKGYAAGCRRGVEMCVESSYIKLKTDIVLACRVYVQVLSAPRS